LLAVAKERLKSPRARLFVALDLADEVRDGLARWQQRALSDPALRAMQPAALHVTLCFLAYHPEKAIPRIAEIVTRAGREAGPVEIRFDPEPVPIPGGRPRLYAVGAASPGAVALQARLERDLAAEGFYEPEKRKFWPHVTVARVRSERLPPERGERRGRGRPQRVSQPPKPLPRSLTEQFFCRRVAVYRSNLKPTGAEYERLAGVDLPSPQGDRRGDERDE
jgi:RNA 2',3'-cyclic 3'-phosphodiesterase